MKKNIRQYSTLNPLTLGIAALLAAVSTDAQAFSKSKSFSAGNKNLGCEAQLAAWDSKTSTSYTIAGSAVATAKLVGFSAPVASGESSLSGSKNGTGNAQLRITAGASTLVNFNRNYSASSTSSLSVSFSTPTYTKKIPIGTAVFMAGVVPVRVTASASLSVRGGGSVSVKLSGGKPVLDGSIGPEFDVAASASGEATVVVGSAGVRGSASLLSASLTGKARLYPSGSQGYVDYGADWSLTGPKGSLDAYARVYLPYLGTKEYTVSIGSFSSSSTRGSLASGTMKLW